MNNTQEKKDSLLPPPELLERYEGISKGLSKNLIELVKKEQLHRQKLQNKYLMHFRLGQLFGSIFLIYVIYMIFNLAKSGYSTLACLMSVVFGLLIVLILFQYKKDKLSVIMRNADKANQFNKRNTNYKRNYTSKREIN